MGGDLYGCVMGWMCPGIGVSCNSFVLGRVCCRMIVSWLGIVPGQVCHGTGVFWDGGNLGWFRPVIGVSLIIIYYYSNII